MNNDIRIAAGITAHTHEYGWGSKPESRVAIRLALHERRPYPAEAGRGAPLRDDRYFNSSRLIVMLVLIGMRVFPSDRLRV